MNGTDILHEGWLVKQGGIVKNWKKRYFILKSGSLEYLTKPGGEVKGVINLAEATSVGPAPESKRQPAFKVSMGKSRVYYIIGDTNNVVNGWLDAIETMMSANRETATEKAPPIADDCEVYVPKDIEVRAGRPKRRKPTKPINQD